MSVLAQQLLLGILIGGLYGLAAAGLSLVFGVLRGPQRGARRATLVKEYVAIH